MMLKCKNVNLSYKNVRMLKCKLIIFDVWGSLIF